MRERGEVAEWFCEGSLIDLRILRERKKRERERERERKRERSRARERERARERARERERERESCKVVLSYECSLIDLRVSRG